MELELPPEASALLDAVVPSLYDSATPQSIAIHEAIADLVAVLMALDSRSLRTAVLERSHNTLAGANAFNGIAEEFGMAWPGPDGVARRALRDLHNQSTLTELSGARPHTLSTLLSAVFTDWPPGPEERENCSTSSAAGITRPRGSPGPGRTRRSWPGSIGLLTRRACATR